MKETRRKGYFQGGNLLYGYKLDGRRIVIDEPAAEVVRYIYDEYSKGEYARNIISHLTEKGIYFKGKPFGKPTVYNILRNEKYSGTYKHGEEVIDNMYPQIVPTEIFYKVRKILDANKYGKTSLQVDYLLRQKLICGNCGQPMNGESGSNKSGVKCFYYKCNGRKKRINNCNKATVRKDVIESLVINTITDKLGDSKIVDFIVAKFLQMQEQQSKENTILSVLVKQQKQVETALNNLVSAVERGIISNTTKKRLEELEQQQEQIEKQILIESSKQITQLSESDIREFYKQALTLEPRMLINFFVKQITVFDDKIEIQFNSPAKVSPDNSQGFSFYRGTVDLIVSLYANTAPRTKKIQIELFA